MKTANRRQFLKLGLGVAATLPALASAATAGGHKTHQVEISGHKFSPATLKMEAGDKVVFVNLDGAPHTATAENGAFDTGRLNRGEDATITVEKTGTHSFFCKFHPGMRGQIVAS